MRFLRGLVSSVQNFFLAPILVILVDFLYVGPNEDRPEYFQEEQEAECVLSHYNNEYHQHDQCH